MTPRRGTTSFTHAKTALTAGRAPLATIFAVQSNMTIGMILLGKHALGHAADVELFDGNKLVAVNDLARKLMHDISALIGNVLVDALELPHGLAAAVRPLDAACHLALRPPQTLLSAPVPARIGYQFSRAERGEVFQTDVNTDILSHRRHRLGVVFDAEADVPSAAAAHGDGLDLAFDLPMPLDADFADALQVELAVFADAAAVA